MTNLTGRKIVLRNADPDGVTTGVFLEFSQLDYTPHVPDPRFVGAGMCIESYPLNDGKTASAIIQLDDDEATLVNIPIADFRFAPMI